MVGKEYMIKFLYPLQQMGCVSSFSKKPKKVLNKCLNYLIFLFSSFDFLLATFFKIFRIKVVFGVFLVDSIHINDPKTTLILETLKA